jgi:hypothetical protein
MRIQGDILPEGQLIVALVQRGEDLCAKTTGRCVVLGPDMIKLTHPGLEAVALGEIMFRRQILQVTSDVES